MTATARPVEATLADPAPPGRAPPSRAEAWRRFRGQRPGVAGLVVIAVLVLVAVLAPLLVRAGALAPPNRVDVASINAGPGRAHLLGADNLGRDLLSRTVFGARVSLLVAVVVDLIGLVVGGAVGLTAGYTGGRVDTLLMRVTDVMYAFPDLLFVLFLAAVLGPGLSHLFVAVGAVSWVQMARVVRAQVRAVRHEPYVEAARAAGTPARRIVLRHIVPNVTAPVIVLLTFGIPAAIFNEAFLSFVGVGVRPPTASWGTMINDGYQAIFAHPGQVAGPVAAIAIATLAFSLVGDALRDALDPRTPSTPASRRRPTEQQV